eukprot:TRINITY_DN15043_c0_g2_i1.p1 TRINITY_DN15043_c0_g2~~TRINITY_DN15043_c0_g2_i1.p1  ORF type:complete len:549 (+),score=151.72 TRINITY_DN15043_c0_g2_i1:81-1649(+)
MAADQGGAAVDSNFALEFTGDAKADDAGKGLEMEQRQQSRVHLHADQQRAGMGHLSTADSSGDPPPAHHAARRGWGAADIFTSSGCLLCFVLALTLDWFEVKCYNGVDRDPLHSGFTAPPRAGLTAMRSGGYAQTPPELSPGEMAFAPANLPSTPISSFLQSIRSFGTEPEDDPSHEAAKRSDETVALAKGVTALLVIAMPAELAMLVCGIWGVLTGMSPRTAVLGVTLPEFIGAIPLGAVAMALRRSYGRAHDAAFSADAEIRNVTAPATNAVCYVEAVDGFQAVMAACGVGMAHASLRLFVVLYRRHSWLSEEHERPQKWALLDIAVAAIGLALSAAALAGPWEKGCRAALQWGESQAQLQVETFWRSRVIGESVVNASGLADLEKLSIIDGPSAAHRVAEAAGATTGALAFAVASFAVLLGVGVWTIVFPAIIRGGIVFVMIRFAFACTTAASGAVICSSTALVVSHRRLRTEVFGGSAGRCGRTEDSGFGLALTAAIIAGLYAVGHCFGNANVRCKRR